MTRNCNVNLKMRGKTHAKWWCSSNYPDSKVRTPQAPG